jgi:hypothetical protein
MVEGIVVHGLFRAAMDAPVGLLVARETERPHRDRPLHGKLGDGLKRDGATWIDGLRLAGNFSQDEEDE